jgi:hypothetical protein
VWPVMARAQQSKKVPTIGLLGSGTASANREWVAAFVQRLRELDRVDGRNIAIEYRWRMDAPSATPRLRKSSSASMSMSLSWWEHRPPSR